MGKSNFLVFNESMNSDTTFNDAEYAQATQRLTGVTPGIALSRQHNKMYRQWSAMCKAVADFLVSHGFDAMDNDIESITLNLTGSVKKILGEEVAPIPNETIAQIVESEYVSSEDAVPISHNEIDSVFAD